MAGQEPNTKEKPKEEAKLPGILPGPQFLSPHLHPGFNSPFLMAAYPWPLSGAACPHHRPSGGSSSAPEFRCVYCLPIQQQQNQNINVNIGGCFMPSGYNAAYNQASLHGVTIFSIHTELHADVRAT